MSNNEATVKAVTKNLKFIIETTIGWKLEDLSAGVKVGTIPLCALSYDDEDFDSSFGERPTYNVIKFKLEVVTSATDKNSSRAAQQEVTHKIKDNITISALNVGDLAVSKLVSWVKHQLDSPEYDKPYSAISYSLSVRYRET